MSKLKLFDRAPQLLEKLERNRWRVWEALKAEDEIEISDGFFDFCITAHALRDWVCKDPDWVEPIGGIEAVYSRHKELQACRDIANSNKHFGLNQTAEKHRSTFSVFPGQSGMVDVYVHETTQKIQTILRDSYDLIVIRESGEVWGLYAFMENVIRAWEVVIRENFRNYS